MRTMQCAPYQIEDHLRQDPPVKEYTIPYHPGASCYIQGEFYDSCPGDAKDLI